MLLDDRPTAFVDLETTGSRAGVHRITEIAVVTATRHGVVDRWSSLINPGREIPLQISALTGIHSEMVADAPAFEDIWRELFERLKGHLFVAHNVRFDYGFLRSAFRSVERSFQPKRLCTVQLSRQLYPGERYHNLDALVQRHALTCEPRHRALTDATALWEWCTKAGNELGWDMLQAAVNDQLKGPALPPNLHRSAVTSLHDGPGVYRFFGSDRALLYVGKSVNVRSRVMAHFSAATREGKERQLFSRAHDVEGIETAGELGALLLEARMIKRDRPILNRALRQRAQTTTLTLTADADGYECVSVEALDTPDADGQHFGLYKNAKAAKRALQALCDEHALCRKKLGLERGPGSCFGYQIKRCRGACVGHQSFVAWNLALRTALGPNRLGDWPFKGPVVLTERRGQRLDLHVVDQWCHLSTVHHRHDVTDAAANEPIFDFDIYRILKRFLDKSAHRVEVTDI